MALPKGASNSGIKNLKKFQKGKSGFSFSERTVVCVHCKKEYVAKGPSAKFCSSSCKEKNRPDRQKNDFICIFCDIPFRRRAPDNAGKFCSRKCSGLFTTANGKKNYFYKAFLTYEHKCNRCDLNKYESLCVHHIDLNHDNNDISNLEILCYNCHFGIHFANSKKKKDTLDRLIMFLKRSNRDAIT